MPTVEAHEVARQPTLRCLPPAVYCVFVASALEANNLTMLTLYLHMPPFHTVSGPHLLSATRARLEAGEATGLDLVGFLETWQAPQRATGQPSTCKISDKIFARF